MKIEKSFYMLEKMPKKSDKDTKEIFLYDEITEAVEKISVYMTTGTSADDIELTEVSIEEEGIKAKVIPWGRFESRPPHRQVTAPCRSVDRGVCRMSGGLSASTPLTSSKRPTFIHASFA
jgi:tryptophanyl-tRNA synthetase